jgi:hypothetical protein
LVDLNQGGNRTSRALLGEFQTRSLRPAVVRFPKMLAGCAIAAAVIFTVAS